MVLFDTHSHVYLREFDNDRADVMERTDKAGIARVIMPAVDSTTHEAMLLLEQLYPLLCLSMMGVHPCSVKEDYQNELKIAEEHFSKRKFIAVGETGLDFYWDVSYKEQQYIAFERQIEWALAFDIPLIIHSRSSTDECIEVVQRYQKGKLKGIFHCFSGNLAQARQIIDLGFYLGIGGVVTFKNAGLDKVVTDLDLQNLVLETDAPYLAPIPFRGKRNEPEYLSYIAKKIADVKDLPLDEVASVTTTNAKKLFGL
jgi:TatD DNase family protein